MSRSPLNLVPNLHAQEEMDEAMAMLATNSRALLDAMDAMDAMAAMAAITDADTVRPFLFSFWMMD